MKCQFKLLFFLLHSIPEVLNPISFKVTTLIKHLKQLITVLQFTSKSQAGVLQCAWKNTLQELRLTQTHVHKHNLLHLDLSVTPFQSVYCSTQTLAHLHAHLPSLVHTEMA